MPSVSSAPVSDPHLETIHVDHREGVATITLDRPARKNAVNALMWDELLIAFRALGGDADARVVVITGAGGEFCSGADLTPGQPGPTNLAGMRHVGDVCLALHRLPQPTIDTARGGHRLLPEAGAALPGALIPRWGWGCPDPGSARLRDSSGRPSSVPSPA